MKLVIVESPSKSKTIEKYLGSNYKVISSKGHIRDLATSGKGGLGVDVENNFEADYKVITGKSKEVKELKQEFKKADEVYLATDHDREGEAISWHIAKLLDLDIDTSKRVVFNEITKDAILKAFDNPRNIDIDLVDAQETRRILDRIIGFKLSKLLQNKIKSRSAGRVQSVVLKLIVDRENEINAFVPEEYWYIDANFDKFNARLTKYKNKKLEISNEDSANKILSELGKDYSVEKIEQKKKSKKAKMPFITSTLQQEASTKLGFGGKKTMQIAQKLYEGVNIGKETVGLITYMRTDSTRLSNEFISSVKTYITNEYGKEYEGAVRKAKSSGNEQDAHEAIRPTSILRHPDSIKEKLSSDEYKLYHLIYSRALASLMADAKVMSTSVDLVNNDYLFRTNGNILVFDGYLKVYSKYEDNKDVILPEILENEIYNAKEVIPSQHFTTPPPRYNEASLVKAMEEHGIGRPSTYVQTISTLVARNYIESIEKRLHPTKQGIETNEALQNYFNQIINIEYTAKMESDLDLIAEHKLDKLDVLTDFYTPFDELINNAYDKMEKKEAEVTGEKCPECGRDLVIRKGRFGEFVACSGYPECKYIQKTVKAEKIIMSCPKCKTGNVIEKKTKRGRIFYGCSNYPDCDFASWNKPTDEICEICGANKVVKGKQIVCENCEKGKKDES